MKSPARCAAWLLPFLLTGCFHLPFHKNQQAQNLQLAPLIEPAAPLEVASVELPPPETVIPAKPIYNMRERAEPIKPPVRHRKPANKAEDEAASNPEVAPSVTPAVSAIGEISSGDSSNLRSQTEGSIAAIERGLNGINRPLSDPEQKIADHIREFLKQARAALLSGDVEGARTLATKAQVLLSELTK